MIEWLFEPFTRFALDTVGVWYLVTVVLMLAPGFLAQYVFGWDANDPFPDYYNVWQKLITAGILAPLIEETIFRILPVELGLGVTAVIAASVVWAFLHGKRGLLILISVPLYVKMALAGMYVEMMLVHAFHNTWLVLASHAGDVLFSDDPEPGSRDLEDIEDDKELLEEILYRVENDGDFDPSVHINGNEYDSFDDVPPGEMLDYIDRRDD